MVGSKQRLWSWMALLQEDFDSYNNSQIHSTRPFVSISKVAADLANNGGCRGGISATCHK